MYITHTGHKSESDFDKKRTLFVNELPTFIGARRQSCSVVRGEEDKGIIVDTQNPQPVQDLTDAVVQLHDCIAITTAHRWITSFTLIQSFITFCMRWMLEFAPVEE